MLVLSYMNTHSSCRVGLMPLRAPFSNFQEHAVRFENLLTLNNAKCLHWSWTDDHQVNKRIRTDEIDILIDLGGHTGNTQLNIMAFCPAPIQVAARSKPGTKSGILPPIRISSMAKSLRLFRAIPPRSKAKSNWQEPGTGDLDRLSQYDGSRLRALPDYRRNM